MKPQDITRGARSVVALGGSMLLAACTVGPNYTRPPLSPAAGYGDQAAYSASGGTGNTADGNPRLIVGADISAQWWQVFHSPELDALVAEALRKNPSIAAAKAALRASRELVRAQRGAYLPSVVASLQPSRQHFPDTLASPLQSGVEHYDLTTTQVTVSYAPDIFGGNARMVESLRAQQDLQRFELEAARLTLASNTVTAAIQDALLRGQILETRAIIAEQEQVVASYQRQFARGQASAIDVAAQQAMLAQVRASLPPLDKQWRINRDMLCALLGRTPGEPVAPGFDLQSLTLPDQLPLALPAQLVEHRPDVRAAEAQLHAASAAVGVAVAARLPNIDIQATAGSAALGLAPAFGAQENFWSLVGTLVQPVFDGGALLHRQRAAVANYDQAAEQYRGTVVAAFQNTADVLQALSDRRRCLARGAGGRKHIAYQPGHRPAPARIRSGERIGGAHRGTGGTSVRADAARRARQPLRRCGGAVPGAGRRMVEPGPCRSGGIALNRMVDLNDRAGAGAHAGGPVARRRRSSPASRTGWPAFPSPVRPG